MSKFLGSVATAMGTPMHLHQTYVGPQMTPMPQSQFQVQSPVHVVYADPQHHGSIPMPMQQQQQPQPPEAQLISFD